MRGFLEAAKIEPKAQFLHIAGTNGKGSVTASVQSLLVEQGFMTGAYFSPYVYDPMERIQIGREMLSRQDFARLATRLFAVAEAPGEEITEFEMKTAIGFAAWEEAGCEWIALEVGLGGRFDATNVIDGEVAVITSISLDHIAILGNTLAEIAFEKAGIIKEGKPVVMGKMPLEAETVILDEARKKGSQVWRLGHEIIINDADSRRRIVITPHGDHGNVATTWFHGPVIENRALAVAAVAAAGLAPSPEVVERAMSLVSLPGRLESWDVGGQIWILDGAHNEAAARALVSYLSELRQKLVIIAGMVAGHEALPFFHVLSPIAERFILVPIDFHRARNPNELAHEIETLGIRTEIAESIEEATEWAKEAGRMTVVTGSFYLVGEVGKTLNADPTARAH